MFITCTYVFIFQYPIILMIALAMFMANAVFTSGK